MDGMRHAVDLARILRLWVPDKVIQTILRHSDANVTLGYCVKPQKTDASAAMDKFEAEIATHNFQDRGTPNPRDHAG